MRPGWRAIFLVNVPISVLVLTLTAGRAAACPRGDQRIDWTAQLTACAVLALLTGALIAAGHGSWAHAAGRRPGPRNRSRVHRP